MEILITKEALETIKASVLSEISLNGNSMAFLDSKLNTNDLLKTLNSFATDPEYNANFFKEYNSPDLLSDEGFIKYASNRIILAAIAESVEADKQMRLSVNELTNDEQTDVLIDLKTSPEDTITNTIISDTLEDRLL